MANQWFKFYGGEYLSDQKIRPLNGAERSCWITLLSFASQSENGVIKFLTEDQLINYSGNEIFRESLNGVLKKFEELEMISLSNGYVTVKNWNKRQLSDSTERVRRFREKQEGNENVTDRKKEEIEKKERKNTPQQFAKDFFNNSENKTKYPDFVSYWTELNKSGTRQRWEDQTHFDVKRRLVTWQKNESTWAKPKFEKAPELRNFSEERRQKEAKQQREDHERKNEQLKKAGLLEKYNNI